MARPPRPRVATVLQATYNPVASRGAGESDYQHQVRAIQQVIAYGLAKR